MSSNWSCILFEKNIVIHCEESNSAFQHFYPIPLLRKYKWKMASESSSPFLYGRLPPARTLSKKFTFPKLNAPPVVMNHMHFEGDPNGFGGFANAILTPGGLLLPLPPDIAANLDAGLADGGAVDLAQLLTPQQLEQLFAQAPLFALLPPGQNHQQLLVQAGLEPGAPLPAQLAINLGHPAASATQPANGGAVGQADAAGPGGQPTVNGDHTNNTSEDAEEDEEDGDGEPNQGNEQGNGFSNPFPFPWYPESAHFVRQWWPTLPGVPRVSCTVVLLAAHDPQTHATRFVLAQHYFRVPLDWKSWKESQPMAVCAGNHQGKGKRKQKRKRRNVNGKTRSDDKLNNERSSTPLSSGTLSEDLGEGPSSPERQLTSDTYDTDYDLSSEDEAECECGWAGEQYDNLSEEDDNDNSMKMWYVSTPFDVVCVSDMDEEEDGQQVERPRPLIAVDFGHAVWIEDGVDGSADGSDDRDSETLASEEEEVEHSQENMSPGDSGGADPQGEEGSPPMAQVYPKRLRFVTFPPYDASSPGPRPEEGQMEGEVRTLKVPDDLDLDSVETINIDQSQGAVILSVRDGKIFILCYE